MRMSTPALPYNQGQSLSVKERKVSQSASCKIDSIIRQLFLPMLGMPTPERTSFLAEDAEDQLLRQVAQERPAALSTESDFVDYMVLLYRKFQRELSAPVIIPPSATPPSVVSPFVVSPLVVSPLVVSPLVVSPSATILSAASKTPNPVQPSAGESSV